MSPPRSRRALLVRITTFPVGTQQFPILSALLGEVMSHRLLLLERAERLELARLIVEPEGSSSLAPARLRTAGLSGV